ncbi:tetraacyldisaccharide 4'-kinase [Allopseudospirillum japonicum]|uniref:Tetraacyldisaccharide 4'-kinase n=1 Tax=Allopseudospirillum japonicum TaxID=64971 RepID=A0A1H6T9I5_9GAMM|nr:tetraacyldisaccharide 4'-kinase [Allopseudospirillum japonicum]SEI76671.1 tetraacyldisaccharide 4'-kinase [Allopseudospirillum japonicum]
MINNRYGRRIAAYLEQSIQAFWYPHTASHLPWGRYVLYALMPLWWSLAHLFAYISKKRACKLRQQAAQYRLEIPVIVVGNLHVGGSGKSPLVRWLAQYWQTQGYQVGIISRGYGGCAPQYPYEVTVNSPVAAAGDEALMLHQQTACPVVVAPCRLSALQYLQKKYPLDLVISDDGLQHYALPRTHELVVVSGARTWGRNALLPLGPLREPRCRLLQADAVIVHQSQAGQLQQMQQEFAGAQALPWIGVRLADYRWHPLAQINQAMPESVGMQVCPWPPGTQVHLVTGISYPQPLIDYLTQHCQLQVQAHLWPDHYQFQGDEFQFADAAPCVVTMKDVVKCQTYLRAQDYIISVDLQVDPELIALCHTWQAQWAGRTHLNREDAHG